MPVQLDLKIASHSLKVERCSMGWLCIIEIFHMMIGPMRLHNIVHEANFKNLKVLQDLEQT